MSSSCAARGASGRAPGGFAIPLILAALCLVLGLALYGVLTGSAADQGGHVPGAAQPFDVAEPGDDAYKAFGGANQVWLNAVPPDAAAFLSSLVFFIVAASGGLLPRFLRGPPARS